EGQRPLLAVRFLWIVPAVAVEVENVKGPASAGKLVVEPRDRGRPEDGQSDVHLGGLQGLEDRSGDGTERHIVEARGPTGYQQDLKWTVGGDLDGRLRFGRKTRPRAADVRAADESLKLDGERAFDAGHPDQFLEHAAGLLDFRGPFGLLGHVS